MSNLYVKHPGRELNTSEQATIEIFGGKYNGIFRTRSGTKYLTFSFKGDLKGCSSILLKKYQLESHAMVPVK